MSRLCLATCLAAALGALAGCGDSQPSAPTAVGVKGTVNIDGKPVPTGEVHFGTLGVPPSVLDIKDGAFAGEAPIGKNQVEVYIYKDGPPSEKYGGARSKTNTTPQRYWGPNTTLSAEVKAGEPNTFKFDIKSK